MACCAGSLVAQSSDIDEKALFSDTVSVVANKPIEESKTKDKTGTAIGGTLNAAELVGANRDYLDNRTLANTSMLSMLVGSVTLDSRLQNDTKVFGNLETDYMPGFDTLSTSMYKSLGLTGPYAIYLRELFMDFNVNRSAYFRVGKQVLQWGRCFFWNPTDFINVEKKSFVEKIGSREGTYGAKLHIPFGTTANVYSFVNMNSVNRIDSISGCAKFEYLFGGTEMALSIWGKRNRPVIFGYDVSSRVAGLDVSGELSVTSGGDVVPHLKQRDASLYVEAADNTPLPRLCVGIGKSFGFLGFPDACSFTLEAFYNGAGYEGNIFSDTTHYIVRAGKYADMPDELKPRATKTEVLVAGNMYDQNYHSRYYAAFFFGISRFFVSDLGCNVNAIMNIEQKCATATFSLSYAMLNNVSLGATLIGYFGDKNTEYTLSGQSAALRINVDVGF